MKKINYLIIAIFGLFISIINASAGSVLGNTTAGQVDSYIAYGSEIAQVLRDEDTTCSEALKEINFDIYSKVNLDYTPSWYFISLTGDYVSGTSVDLNMVYTYSNSIDKPTLIYDSDGSVYLNASANSSVRNRRLTFDCNTKMITLGDEEFGNGYYQPIFEKADIGYRFYSRFFQSSIDSLFLSGDALQGSAFRFVGVYDSSGVEKMSSADFLGTDYLDNHLLLGHGVPLLPFRNYLVGSYGDAPLTGNYDYIFVSDRSQLFLTSKIEDISSYDPSIYIRPAILQDDGSWFSESTLELKKKPMFNYSYFKDYKNILDSNMYAMYYNDEMIQTNGFYKLEAFNSEFCSTCGMNLQLTSYFTGSMEFVVYYDNRVWNMNFVSDTAINNGSSITLDGINGEVTIDNETLKQNNVNVSTSDKVIIDNGSGEEHTSGFLDMLLGGIEGVSKFLESVMSGITTLTGSITAIITACFTFLSAMPPEVSSVLYLCFLSGIIAIILKIFL